jgi:radical SAM protein with 4Fe4S-binding SPASM domain
MYHVLKVGRKIKIIADLILRHPKGWFDFLLSLLSYGLKSSYVLGRPVHITIEPANICNLQCSVCETGAGQLKRAKGQITLAQFKNIISQVQAHTNTLLFYFMGEPFLNKEAYDMIAYARSKNIFVTTCTNGEIIDASRLVETGLNEISFQIGGLTQKTHQAYRVGSDLEQVSKNISAVIAEKRKRRATAPRIILGFIVMKHNEHELFSLDRFGRDLGVDEVQVISPCVRTVDQARQFLPADKKYWLYDEQKLSAGVLSPLFTGKKDCRWIYFSTTILWSGEVVPCCRDAQGEMVMGNIFQEDISRIWNGPRYRSFRKKLLKQPAEIGICHLCSGYGFPNLS